MVTLGQLWARRELALDIVVDPPGARSLDITIVHSSELLDVDAWLAGGELLLTIGMTQDLGAESVERFVDRLIGVGVRGLGIGLGATLPLQTIPDRLITYARQSGLALFAVPEPVPFVAVVDAFTRLREEETNRELTRASRAQRRFATALAHSGPGGLVADLAETLETTVQFVSPTGRGLAGTGASADIRAQLIIESTRTSFVPRLLRTSDGAITEAVPVGDAQVCGWILTPAEETAGPRFRSLLLSTAAALLSLEVTEQAPLREESRLFTSHLSASDARAEWLAQTGHAPASGAELTVYADVRDESVLRLMTDLSPAVLVARSGTMMGVVHTGQPLVARVAEVGGAQQVFSKNVPLTQIRYMWTVWRTQHEGESSELGALLSAIDEPVADDFVERVLGRFLKSEAGRELLVTLRAFIAAGGVRDQTAADLGIHRHTVRARMVKVENLLGRDLSKPGTVQTVAIALALTEF